MKRISNTFCVLDRDEIIMYCQYADHDKHSFIVELSEDEYIRMFKRYSDSPVPRSNRDSTWAEIKKYAWEHPRRVFEGPNIL